MAIRDDTVLGRARVEDNRQLEEYYAALERLNAGALWTVANKIEPWEPAASSDAVHWRYEDLRPHVLRATELVTPEQAGRRVVWLANPRRRDVAATCGWLYSGLQVMLPGEYASAHKHGASALRFILEGSGAYTVVNGEKTLLGANDFVITPSGTWHDHGNEGNSGPAIWQDGLDIPFVNALDANWYAVYEETDDGRQVPDRALDYSAKRYVSSGVLPEGETWSKRYSPLLRFPWERTYESLTELASSDAGSPFDGTLLRYSNPLTGGHVMPTMGAHIQRLREGEAYTAHRHTGNVIYTVAKGSGHSIVGGRRFEWSERDIFCVPSWVWHEHANGSQSEDAVLFSFSDLPVIESLELYMEQALEDNGGHQDVTA
jgi:gentisate 1,2-dioxygenase